MEENKEKKTITLSLSTGVSLIIIIMLSVVILAMAYFYNIKDIKGKNQNRPENSQSTNVIPTKNVTPTEEAETKNEIVKIKTGKYVYKYTVQSTESQTGTEEVETSIELKEDKSFKYIESGPLGATGKYEVLSDGRVLCTVERIINEHSSIRDAAATGYFTLKIVDENTIEIADSGTFKYEEKVLPETAEPSLKLNQKYTLEK